MSLTRSDTLISTIILTLHYLNINVQEQQSLQHVTSPTKTFYKTIRKHINNILLKHILNWHIQIVLWKKSYCNYD